MSIHECYQKIGSIFDNNFLIFFKARGLYFSVDNLMEWICYVTAIVFVFDFDDCTLQTGVRLGWQWQVGAVSITMCWLNLVRNFTKNDVASL